MQQFEFQVSRPDSQAPDLRTPWDTLLSFAEEDKALDTMQTFARANQDRWYRVYDNIANCECHVCQPTSLTNTEK